MNDMEVQIIRKGSSEVQNVIIDNARKLRRNQYEEYAVVDLDNPYAVPTYSQKVINAVKDYRQMRILNPEHKYKIYRLN